MRPDDLVGYTYRAANYCEHCLPGALTPAGHNSVSSLPIEAMLNRLAANAGIDRDHEYSFDSDTFPKALLRDSAEKASGWGDDATCEGCDTDLALADPIDWRTAANEREAAR